MKYFCVISHTHWDREWYMPLELFRLKLVDLMDRCLETLEKYPEFIFHLDAQTIVLEDYLDFRPSRRTLLEKYITEGRLVVGPWYLQNDFYLTSGEATIRNLLEGHKIAHAFGFCSKVGYAPDQFGNISQLPQILANFGIDNFIFGRGISHHEYNEKGELHRIPNPTEFIWQGADGTEALAIHMAHWYNNAQRFPANIDNAKLLIDIIEGSFKDIAVTPYLLLMNGVDHLEAQDDLLPILEEVDKVIGEGRKVMQYRMDHYVEDVKAYIRDNHVALWKHSGEMRSGGDWEILKGTLSSRAYLKKANVLAQNTLECKLEPIYTMMEMAGARGVFSNDHFRFMWKQLMKNHPHDSICGCSRDEVHMHMEDNYKRLDETTGEMLRRGLDTASLHMGTNGFDPSNYIILLANTTEIPQSGVVEVTLQFPQSEKVTGFDITDHQGRAVKFDILSKTATLKDVFSPLNLPGVLDVDSYRIYVYASDTAPLSLQGLIVTPKTDGKAPIALTCDTVPAMENEYLKVAVDKDGRICITDKASGSTVENAIEFVEDSDRGESYVHFVSEDRAISSAEFTPAVQVIEKNEYISRIKITWDMVVPAYYDFDAVKRSEETAVCRIDLLLTLKKGVKYLEAEYTLDNQAKDHRIRLHVNTGILSNVSTADIPFDIVTHSHEDHYPETMSRVFPNTSFALLEDGTRGTAIFTEGTHEYEHIQREKGALAFTLVRSTGVIGRGMDLKPSGGDQWNCPDNQCIRTMSGRFGFMLYTGGYDSAEIPLHAKSFRNPVIGYFNSCDYKKFAGGRFAVQDAKLAEFYYVPDPYKNTRIPDGQSFVTIEGKGLTITAVKKSEDGEYAVVRMLNYTQAPVEATVGISGRLYLSTMSEEKEEYIGENSITLTFQPKQMITIKAKLPCKSLLPA